MHGIDALTLTLFSLHHEYEDIIISHIPNTQRQEKQAAESLMYFSFTNINITPPMTNILGLLHP